MTKHGECPHGYLMALTAEVDEHGVTTGWFYYVASDRCSLCPDGPLTSRFKESEKPT